MNEEAVISEQYILDFKLSQNEINLIQDTYAYNQLFSRMSKEELLSKELLLDSIGDKTKKLVTQHKDIFSAKVLELAFANMDVKSIYKEIFQNDSFTLQTCIIFNVIQLFLSDQIKNRKGYLYNLKVAIFEDKLYSSLVPESVEPAIDYEKDYEDKQSNVGSETLSVDKRASIKSKPNYRNLQAVIHYKGATEYQREIAKQTEQIVDLAQQGLIYSDIVDSLFPGELSGDEVFVVKNVVFFIAVFQVTSMQKLIKNLCRIFARLT